MAAPSVSEFSSREFRVGAGRVVMYLRKSYSVMSFLRVKDSRYVAVDVDGMGKKQAQVARDLACFCTQGLRT